MIHVWPRSTQPTCQASEEGEETATIVPKTRESGTKPVPTGFPSSTKRVRVMEDTHYGSDESHAKLLVPLLWIVFLRRNSLVKLYQTLDRRSVYHRHHKKPRDSTVVKRQVRCVRLGRHLKVAGRTPERWIQPQTGSGFDSLFAVTGRRLCHTLFEFIVQGLQLEALAQPRSHVMSGHLRLKLHYGFLIFNVTRKLSGAQHGFVL